MNDKSADPQPKRSDWTDRLGSLASLIGATVGLIAALGFPSASWQYFRLGIPEQFLSYDRALRAGVLPAAVLVLVLVFLYSVGGFASRITPGVTSKREFEFKSIPWPAKFIVYPLLAMFSAILVSAFLIAFAAICYWIAFLFGWMAKSFGLRTVLVALAVLLVVVATGVI